MERSADSIEAAVDRSMPISRIAEFEGEEPSLRVDVV